MSPADAGGNPCTVRRATTPPADAGGNPGAVRRVTTPSADALGEHAFNIADLPGGPARKVPGGNSMSALQALADVRAAIDAEGAICCRANFKMTPPIIYQYVGIV